MVRCIVPQSFVGPAHISRPEEDAPIAELTRHGATGAVSGATSDAVRRRNLGAILRRVHLGGPASRSELAAWTGLNRITVADLVGDLVERVLVRERRAHSTGVPGGT